MKITFDEEATLNYVTQEEELELSHFDRLIGFRRSTIFTTNELSKKYKKPLKLQNGNITFATFKPNFILLAVIALIFIGLVINGLVNPNHSDGFSLLIPFVIFISMGVVIVIFDYKRNFKIILSKDAIKIRDFSYKWDQINEFYIIRRRKGKGYLYFLILALDTGVTDRYEFTNLMGFGETDVKLSACIEYYKNIA